MQLRTSPIFALEDGLNFYSINNVKRGFSLKFVQWTITFIRQVKHISIYQTKPSLPSVKFYTFLDTIFQTLGLTSTWWYWTPVDINLNKSTSVCLNSHQFVIIIRKAGDLVRNTILKHVPARTYVYTRSIHLCFHIIWK